MPRPRHGKTTTINTTRQNTTSFDPAHPLILASSPSPWRTGEAPSFSLTLQYRSGLRRCMNGELRKSPPPPPRVPAREWRPIRGIFSGGQKAQPHPQLRKCEEASFFSRVGKYCCFPSRMRRLLRSVKNESEKTKNINECGCTESRGLSTQNSSREEDQKEDQL